MATPTMKEILESTRKFIQMKEAEFKTNLKTAEDAKDITTKHTLDADEPAVDANKKPTVSGDAKAAPPSDDSGTGKIKAKGKDETNVLGREDTLTAEDPAPAAVKKEDMVSGNADAKTAAIAKLANEILNDIRSMQKKSQEESEKKVKNKNKDTEKSENAKKEQADDKNTSADNEDTVADDQEITDKQSSNGLQLELTSDVLQKIAAMVLSTEEGVDFVEQLMAKAAGEEAAVETLSFLAEQSDLAEKAAAYKLGAAAADEMLINEIYNSGVEDGVKQAGLYEKLGQSVADASIDELMHAQNALDNANAAVGEESAEDEGENEYVDEDEEVTADDIAAALSELVDEGTLDEESAAAIANYLDQELGLAVGDYEDEKEAKDDTSEEEPVDTNVSIEDIDDALVSLVQEQVISPEEAEAVVDYLEGASEDAGDEEEESDEAEEESEKGEEAAE